MSRRLLGAVAVAIAIGVSAVGAIGAVGYGRDYDVHRGFARLVNLPRAGTGRLLEVPFFSRALHRRTEYLVYLPPGYSSTRRYPVYYLLHGSPGQPRVFVDIANMDVRLDNQLSLGRTRPMILVYPDGRIDGHTYSDSEWANSPSGDYESYVVNVVHSVDRRFSTLANRRDRVIGGFSAGGFGAINIALHNLSLFASVQVWSGYFTETRTGVFAHASRATLAANSPIDELTRLDRQLLVDPLRVYMFAGRDDRLSAHMPAMARALAARHARVSWRFYAGGHDWSVWYPRLDQMLDLASWDTTHPPTPAYRSQSSRPPLSTSTVAESAGPAALVGHHRGRWRPHRLALLAALALVLIAATLINLGFVLQHRGRAAADGDSLLEGLRNRTWLAGQAIGWAGFALQIVALAAAPLTLVQAFAAGSLAISIPLMTRWFGWRLERRQLLAVGLVAVSLASLPVGFSARHTHLDAGLLLLGALIGCGAALLLGLRGRDTARAIAAGIAYGVADGAIKADTIGLRRHGVIALLSGWTVLAALATLAGFLAFQAALRSEDPVKPIALMNAFAAVASVGLGLIGFRENLGTTPLAVAVHVAAIVMVLACVRPLTRAQERLIHPEAPAPGGDRRGRRAWLSAHPLASGVGVAVRTLEEAGSGLVVAFVVMLVAAGSVGLLYQLRQLRWLAYGPRVGDALPLLQLAGFAGQPLARVLAASLISGIVIGIVLVRIPVACRTPAVALVVAALLLFASDASYALTQNLRLAHVLVIRAPGLGPWVQCMALAIGSALPAAVARVAPGRSRQPAGERTPRRRTGTGTGAGAGAGAGATEICA
jgi:enterochelin esterase-like enzyme